MCMHPDYFVLHSITDSAFMVTVQLAHPAALGRHGKVFGESLREAIPALNTIKCFKFGAIMFYSLTELDPRTYIVKPLKPVYMITRRVQGGWLLEFSVLSTSKVISGWIPTCDSVHSVTLKCCPTGNSGRQHHDPISHSVTLS